VTISFDQQSKYFVFSLALVLQCLRLKCSTRRARSLSINTWRRNQTPFRKFNIHRKFIEKVKYIYWMMYTMSLMKLLLFINIPYRIKLTMAFKLQIPRSLQLQPSERRRGWAEGGRRRLRHGEVRRRMVRRNFAENRNLRNLPRKLRG